MYSTDLKNGLDHPRGFKYITTEQFNKILKATRSEESFIVD